MTRDKLDCTSLATYVNMQRSFNHCPKNPITSAASVCIGQNHFSVAIRVSLILCMSFAEGLIYVFVQLIFFSLITRYHSPPYN